jgi:VIT1/CCC1 family predicted Fe2+/Mn2+ transporter
MNNEVETENSSTERESISELLGQLARNSAAVLRDEIQLVIQRIREKVKSALTGAILIVTGAVIVFAAFMCLCAAMIIGLTCYMSPVIAALVTGVALALCGVVIAFIGYGQLKKAGPQ